MTSSTSPLFSSDISHRITMKKLNGFSMFAMEQQKVLGVTFPEACENAECAAKWQNFSAEQKTYFKNKAVAFNQSHRKPADKNSAVEPTPEKRELEDDEGSRPTSSSSDFSIRTNSSLESPTLSCESRVLDKPGGYRGCDGFGDWEITGPYAVSDSEPSDTDLDELNANVPDVPHPAFAEIELLVRELDTNDHRREMVRNLVEAYRSFTAITHQHILVVHCAAIQIPPEVKRQVAPCIRNGFIKVAVCAVSLNSGLEPISFSEFIELGSVDLVQGGTKDGDIPGSKENVKRKSPQSYYDFYLNLLRFCGFTGNNQVDLLPLLAGAAHVAQVEGCFRWMQHRAEEEARAKKLTELPVLKFATLEGYLSGMYQMKWFEFKRKISVELSEFRKIMEYGDSDDNDGLSCRDRQGASWVGKCALSAAREAASIVLQRVRDSDILKLPVKEEPRKLMEEPEEDSDSE